MSYVLTETAKCVVASAADFVRQGLLPPPSTRIEGRFEEAMDSQRQHDTAIAPVPAIVEVLNAWTIEVRTTWIMNNLQTDEQYHGTLDRHARRLDLRARPGGAESFSVCAKVFPRGTDEAALYPPATASEIP